MLVIISLDVASWLQLPLPNANFYKKANSVRYQFFLNVYLAITFCFEGQANENPG